MVQILQRPPSLGEQFGNQFGTGLSNALQLLAQEKIGQLSRQRGAKGLEALGFMPEQASSLAFLDPKIQQEIVKRKLLEPSEQAYAQALSSLLGGGQQQPQDLQGLSLLQQLQPQQPLSEQQMIEQAELREEGKLPPSALPSQSDKRSLIPQIPLKLTAKQAEKLAELGLKQRELGEKRRVEAFKLTKPERKAIIEKAHSARQNLRDLERLEELEKEGKLDTPGYTEFLKRSGFDIPALMNPGSEEFQKIAQTFMRDAKTYLGARVTNYELEQFLKTIPSLSQSPEGRKRVIANLKNFSRTALEYNNALKEIMQENKGVPPLDLEEQIDDRVEKRLDKLAEKFKEELAKPVPKGQNRLITALQAGLGSLLGAPGNLVSGAGSAAKVGPELAALL